MAVQFVPLIWVGGGAIVAAGAFVAAYLNWSKIKKSIKGDTVLLIGPRGVGKTTLSHFLTTGEIKDHKQNSTFNILRGRKKVPVEDANLKIRTINDMVGSKSDYNNWEKKYKEADHVFYLVRVADLVSDNQKAHERLSNDFNQIKEWVKANKKKVVVVATFADKALSGEGDQKKEFAKLKDEVEESQIFHKIIALGGGKNNVPLVVGSLVNKEIALSLTNEIFKESMS